VNAPEQETHEAAPAGWWLVAIAWTAVGVPLAWGIWKTLAKALILFR
jgi:hypothetical protein